MHEHERQSRAGGRDLARTIGATIVLATAGVAVLVEGYDNLVRTVAWLGVAGVVVSLASMLLLVLSIGGPGGVVSRTYDAAVWAVTFTVIAFGVTAVFVDGASPWIAVVGVLAAFSAAYLSDHGEQLLMIAGILVAAGAVLALLSFLIAVVSGHDAGGGSSAGWPGWADVMLVVGLVGGVAASTRRVRCPDWLACLLLAVGCSSLGAVMGQEAAALLERGIDRAARGEVAAAAPAFGIGATAAAFGAAWIAGSVGLSLTAIEAGIESGRVRRSRMAEAVGRRTGGFNVSVD